MAITKTYIGVNMNAWTTFLSGTGLFSSVTLEDNTITCKNENNDTVLTITYTLSSGQDTWQFTVFLTGNNSFTKSYSLTGGTAGENYGCKCENGVILYFNGSTGYTSVLITKNNHGAPTFVLPNSTSAKTTIYCLTYEDTVPVSSYQITNTSATQTVLSPFITNAAEGQTSYTPNAFYMSFGPYVGRGLAKFIMNGKIYLTNGILVISDGQVSI